MVRVLDRSYADGAIVVVEFDSGHEGNRLDRAAVHALRRRLGELAQDPPRVLMLTGAGPNFCAGAHLDELSGMGAAEYEEFLQDEYGLFEEVEAFPSVTIAALTGECVGNGAELALACDLRVAAPSTRIILPEVIVGFPAPARRLCRFVGPGIAFELLCLGRSVGVDEALALGLVNRVVEAETHLDRALELAQIFGRRDRKAVALTREAIRSAFTRTPSDAVQISDAVSAFDGLASVRLPGVGGPTIQGEP